jgi:hypothetical protein
MKDKFDKLMNFIFDSKKYHYYLAVLVFIFIALILGKCTDSEAQDKNPMSGAYASYKDVSKDGKKSDNKEIISVITAYYKAYAKGDVDGVKKVARPLSDKEGSYIAFFSQYIEKYDDIKVYSKRGLDSNSYLISVSMKIKFKNIKTEAAGLDFFYLKKNDKGKIYIANEYSNFNTNNSEFEMDNDVVKLIAAFEEQNDVQNLQTQVQQDFNEAMVKDDDLNNFLSDTLPNATKTWASNYQEEKQKEEESKKAQAAARKQEAEQKKAAEEAAKKQEEQNQLDEQNKVTKYTTQAVNIYDKAGTDGNVLGTLAIGTEVTKYADEGSFSRINYNDNHNAYIESQYLADSKPTGTEVINVDGLAAGSTITLTNSVRIRAEMSETSAITAVAFISEPLTIVENYSSGWSKVTSHSGVTGYAKTELLH